MGRSLLIVGTGGQGKMALDCACSMGIYDEIAFFTNDEAAPSTLVGHSVMQVSAYQVDEVMSAFDETFIAVGDNHAREQLFAFYEDKGAVLTTLVHPRSYVSPFSRIGRGSIIMPHATVNAFASVGVGCIVNTNAVVEHDCQLGSFVHVSPSAVMGGGVVIGERSWLCIGACVRDHIAIGSDIIVGANSCVLHDVSVPGVYVGSPAKRS